MRRDLWLVVVVLSCKSYTADEGASDGGSTTSGDAASVFADGGDAAAPSDGGGRGPSCDRTAHFKDPKPVAELNSAKQQSDARLSPDERTVYFVSNRALAPDAGPLTPWETYVATRASRDVPFEPPTKLAGGTTGFAPTVSPDGLWLFISQRVASNENAIFLQHRSKVTDPFGPPVKNLDDGNSNYYSFLTSTGAALYYFSIRGGTDTSWYRAPFDNGTLGAPVKAPGLGGDIETAIVSPDELTTYYSVWASDLHMWTASRSSTSEAFGAPIQLTEVDGAIETYPDWISADGCRLYFHGDRPGAAADGYNIWVATR